VREAVQLHLKGNVAIQSRPVCLLSKSAVSKLNFKQLPPVTWGEKKKKVLPLRGLLSNL